MYKLGRAARPSVPNQIHDDEQHGKIACAAKICRGMFSQFAHCRIGLRSIVAEPLQADRALNAVDAEKPTGEGGLFVDYAGDHLISHTLTRAVPSAQRGLTSVFGMGTGGTLAVNSPANFRNIALAIFHN